jgi:hypothetical protein
MVTWVPMAYQPDELVGLTVIVPSFAGDAAVVR